ncbi:MAG: hypothetical protein OXF27_09510 [Acidobacteria bacterium]|nr:hypothetical protein [Acidobacteriota bacterium]
MKGSVSGGFVLSAVCVFAAGTTLGSYHYWDVLRGEDSAGAAIRNIGLVAGSIVAIGLALWRSHVGQRQVEVAEQDSLDGQFQKAAEMLGHGDVFVRLGGVITLYYLGKNHLDRYGYQVCAILDQFSLLKRGSGAEQGPWITIERVKPGGKGTLKYKGPADGGQAFEAFWDLQEAMGGSRRGGKKAKELLHRLVERVRC